LTWFKLELTLLILVVLTPILVDANTISPVESIRYELLYEPLENTGLLVLKTSISLGDCSSLYIPVKVVEAYFGMYEYIDYTVEGNLHILGSYFNESTGILEVVACGSGVFEAYFAVNDLFFEYGPGVYSVIVDTSDTGLLTRNNEVYLNLLNPYNISYNVFSNGIIVEVDQTGSRVLIRGVGSLELVLTSELGEEEPGITTTPQPPTTTTPRLDTTPTRPATETTNTPKSTTTTPLNETHTIKPLVSNRESGNSGLLILGIVLIIGVVVFFLVKKKSV